MTDESRTPPASRKSPSHPARANHGWFAVLAAWMGGGVCLAIAIWVGQTWMWAGGQPPSSGAWLPLLLLGLSVVFALLATQLSAGQKRLAELDELREECLEDQRRANQDRREMFEAKSKSEAASQAKGEFLARMSHELRTPLHGVIGMTRLALETHLTRDQREYLESAEQSANSLLRTVEDLLDFSQIESGKCRLAEGPFLLRESLEAVLADYAELADRKGIGLSWHVAPAVPTQVVGDEHRLRQVIGHLVGNAVKFTQDGKVSLDVSAATLADRRAVLRFTVRDTGIGFSKEQRPDLSNPFFQADSSRGCRYEGVGLGLAICSRLVPMMGGQIWAESSLGEGSCFEFTVSLRWDPQTTPSAAVEPVAASRASRSRSATRPVVGRQTSESQSESEAGRLASSSRAAAEPAWCPRILLAEDLPLNQRIIRHQLCRLGCEVVVAADGKQAVELVGRQTFDLVLMDVQMPVMDGMDATRKIRAWEKERGTHLPIVALTANAMQGDRERCLQAGMDGYMTKPLRADEFARTLDAFVPGHGFSIGGADGATTLADPLAPDPSADEPLDRETALARLEGDTEILSELAELFQLECPKLMDGVAKAVVGNDVEATCRATHRLTGAVGNFFARPTAESIRELEAQVRAGDREAIESAWHRLQYEVRRLQFAVEQLLRQPDEPTNPRVRPIQH